MSVLTTWCPPPIENSLLFEKLTIAHTGASPHLQWGMIPFSRPFTPFPYQSVQSHSNNSVHCCAFENAILLLKFPISLPKKTLKAQIQDPLAFPLFQAQVSLLQNSWALNQHSLSSLALWLFQLWLVLVYFVHCHRSGLQSETSETTHSPLYPTHSESF